MLHTSSANIPNRNLQPTPYILLNIPQMIAILLFLLPLFHHPFSPLKNPTNFKLISRFPYILIFIIFGYK